MSACTPESDDLVSVGYWLEEECIFSFWTKTYPCYRPHEELYLTVQQSPVGHKHWPHVESRNDRLIIDRVVHVVSQSVTDTIDTHMCMEVHLRRPGASPLLAALTDEGEGATS